MTARHDHGPRRADDVETEDAEGERGHEPGLRGGDEREGGRVAEQEVELRERHRHQPLERARRPLAQHRDRRDEEHRRQREEPDERPADAVEHRAAEEDVLQQRDRARTGRRRSARPCAGRGGAGGARARAVAPVMRRLTRRLLGEAEERLLEVVEPPCARGARRASPPQRASRRGAARDRRSARPRP